MAEESSHQQFPAVSFGQRFVDDGNESAYRYWRIGRIAPVLAREAGWPAIACWVFVPFMFLFSWPEMELEVTMLTFLVAIPAMLGATWLSSRAETRADAFPAFALATVLAGVLPLYLCLRVDAPYMIAGSTMISVFYPYTILRLPPRMASLTVVAHVLVAELVLLYLFLVGRIDRIFLVGDNLLIGMSWIFGLSACLGSERHLRTLFWNETALERQRQSLIEERANLSRFLAPEVTRLVRERGIDATLVQETLALTVVCCDLRGFTHFTQSHGAARMAEVLREYYSTVTESARDFGGTVKDFAGDGALILIGAPLARDDHASAGLELARHLIKTLHLQTQAWGTPEAPLGIGAGVATGPCAVGAIGSQNRLEYTAVGPAVNLAARLCAQAGNGDILIDPRTTANLESASGWRFEAMRLKGFSEPVMVRIESRLTPSPLDRGLALGAP